MIDGALVAAAATSAVPGALVGLLTGLVPGLHANNLAHAFLAYPAVALAPVAGAAGAASGSPEAMAASAGFLFGMALGHAFSDDVPAVFLGAPDAETALSVLPGHRLLAAGRGVEAVRAAARGSLLGVLFCLPLVPLLAWLMGPPTHGYEAVRPALPPVLVGLAGVLVLMEKGSVDVSRTRARLIALGALLASAALGDTVMFRGLPEGGSLLFGIPTGAGGAPLLALFAGLFGVPTLVLSAFAGASPPDPAPEADGGEPIGGRETAGYAALGTGAGAFVGWLPGVGAAQATTLAFACWDRIRWGRRRPRSSDAEAAAFLVAASAVGTANLVFNLVALSVLQRERSGVMVALDEVAGPSLAGGAADGVLLGLFVGAVGVLPLCYIFAVRAGGGAARLYRKASPQFFSRIALASLVVMVALLEGPVGLLVAALAAAVGMVPPAAGVKRVHLMGCVLLPVSLRIAGL